MSAHRINLQDFKERKDREGRIEIETGEGGPVFTIPPPEVWSDDVIDGTLNDVEVARALIGEDRYPEYIEAGGTALMLAAIIAEVHGAKLGK